MIHRGLGFVYGDVGTHRRPTAVAVGLARDLAVCVNAEPRAGCHLGKARKLVPGGGAGLRERVHVRPIQIVAAHGARDGRNPAPRRRDLVGGLEHLVETLGAGFVVDEGAGLFGVGRSRQDHGGGLGRRRLEVVHDNGAIEVYGVGRHAPVQIVFHDHRHRPVANALEGVREGQGAAEQRHAVAVRFRGGQGQHGVLALGTERQGDIGRRLDQGGFACLAAGDDQRAFGGGERFGDRGDEGVQSPRRVIGVDRVRNAESRPGEIDGVAVPGRCG